jgi:hypothetical protein
MLDKLNLNSKLNNKNMRSLRHLKISLWLLSKNKGLNSIYKELKLSFTDLNLNMMKAKEGQKKCGN